MFGVVDQFPAGKSTSTPDWIVASSGATGYGTPCIPGQTLVVAFAMVMAMNSALAFRTALSPKKIIRSRHDSLIHYKPFRVGVQFGNARWKLHRGNTSFGQQAQELGVNNGSRSWIR
jgi:hypothetical protein